MTGDPCGGGDYVGPEIQAPTGWSGVRLVATDGAGKRRTLTRTVRVRR